MTPQINSKSTVSSTAYLGSQQWTYQSSALLLLVPGDGDPPATDGFPARRTNNAENVPCHEVIM